MVWTDSIVSKTVITCTKYKTRTQ